MKYHIAMARPDLNLLYTLEVLLVEGNVTRAAERLRLSPSAMSRSLARLRTAMGDPLLVRAGRGLVPTPRAIELYDRIGPLVREAEAILRPVTGFDPRQLARTFNIRASQGFVENFGAALISKAREEAPEVRLCFVEKTRKESVSLREAAIDLEIGVVGAAAGPELRARVLFRERFIGVVQKDHPLSKGSLDAGRYAKADHIAISRRGIERGPIDEALASLGLRREVLVIVGGFSTAISLARHSGMVATVPERQTGNLREDMFSFSLPFALPEIAISMLWHPRFDADQAHTWLRNMMLDDFTARMDR